MGAGIPTQKRLATMRLQQLPLEVPAPALLKTRPQAVGKGRGTRLRVGATAGSCAQSGRITAAVVKR
jgi:hypothetical protein